MVEREQRRVLDVIELGDVEPELDRRLGLEDVGGRVVAVAAVRVRVAEHREVGGGRVGGQREVWRGRAGGATVSHDWATTPSRSSRVASVGGSRATSRRSRHAAGLELLVAALALRAARDVVVRAVRVHHAGRDRDRGVAHRARRRRVPLVGHVEPRRRIRRSLGGVDDLRDVARLDAHAVARELLPDLRAHREHPVVHVGGVDLLAGRDEDPAALRRGVGPQDVLRRVLVDVGADRRARLVDAQAGADQRVGLERIAVDRRVVDPRRVVERATGRVWNLEVVAAAKDDERHEGETPHALDVTGTSGDTSRRGLKAASRTLTTWSLVSLRSPLM